MKVRCVWEHNGDDSLLYAENFTGAFTRGNSKDCCYKKMVGEISSYLQWSGGDIPDAIEIDTVQEKSSGLDICDADSDVIFDTEKNVLTASEYGKLKALALKSAQDFLDLYNSVPDKDVSCLPARKTFYGAVPRTAREMYEHTKSVNGYYFAEIGVDADDDGNIVECRRRGFELLEKTPSFLKNEVFDGSYGEQWSLRKVLRRFIWHDRIHAKAMYRMAIKTFGEGKIPNLFSFKI